MFRGCQQSTPAPLCCRTSVENGLFRSLRNLRAETPAIPRACSAFAEINPVRLLRSEDAVAGVAEAGDDVGVLVEAVVDGAGVDDEIIVGGE